MDVTPSSNEEDVGPNASSHSSAGHPVARDQQPSLTQAQEALRAIQNVEGGADPTAEALALSNRYTERNLERLASLWSRLRPGR